MKKLILFVMLILFSSFAYGLSATDPDLLWYLDLEQADENMLDQKDNGKPTCDFHYDGIESQQAAVAPYGSFSVGINNDYIRNQSCAVDMWEGASNFTVCHWIGDANWGVQKTILHMTSISAKGIFSTTEFGTYRMNVRISGGSNWVQASKAAFGTLYCFRWNGTVYSWFLNGTQDTLFVSSTQSDRGSDHISIGNDNSADSLDGIIDDWSFWNRTLTPAEMIDLTNNGLTVSDSVPPLITNALCTSCIIGTNNTLDSTPTINDTLDETGTSCISNQSTGTYSDCRGRGGLCSNGADNVDVCTIPSNQSLTNFYNIQTLYLWANDSLGNSHTVFNNTINVTLVNQKPNTPTITAPPAPVFLRETCKSKRTLELNVLFMV